MNVVTPARLHILLHVGRRIDNRYVGACSAAPACPHLPLPPHPPGFGSHPTPAPTPPPYAHARTRTRSVQLFWVRFTRTRHANTAAHARSLALPGLPVPVVHIHCHTPHGLRFAIPHTFVTVATFYAVTVHRLVRLVTVQLPTFYIYGYVRGYGSLHFGGSPHTHGSVVLQCLTVIHSCLTRYVVVDVVVTYITFILLRSLRYTRCYVVFPRLLHCLLRYPCPVLLVVIPLVVCTVAVCVLRNAHYTHLPTITHYGCRTVGCGCFTTIPHVDYPATPPRITCVCVYLCLPAVCFAVTFARCSYVAPLR